ncbi:NAD(P)H-dependent oxidoreductase [Neolewinella lacunae]|uniref:NAD(P)H-dependent oxidoreductase n=1 Tax=Neolewinella lacunae TaxID=1517758 RepID=A0A923T7S3_9BACT|nr:NAD(P)H-dependent oxidoreductase [Neolewinella lacunae]MBC6993821.1 NAD(P)H-dependent oxidoreductase [Neolewinella lacunae]MDN3635288.1 NAD(P)H-dependent oxidoreductase [Neolewinella lacunae]
MTTTSSSLLTDLNWRYATKKFDTSKKVSAEDLETIMSAVNLAATSYGLQPFRVMHVQDPAVREKLKAAAYGQPQITDADHLFVFCHLLEVSDEYVDDYIARIAAERNTDVANLKGFGDTIKGSLGNKTSQEVADWTRRQAYIALGHLLVTAATLRVDSCPMEGFDAAAFGEILGLKDQGLGAAVVATVGYRSEEDQLQHAAKVRLPLTELFHTV